MNLETPSNTTMELGFTVAGFFIYHCRRTLLKHWLHKEREDRKIVQETTRKADARDGKLNGYPVMTHMLDSNEAAGIPPSFTQKGGELKALEEKHSSREQENEVGAPANSAVGAIENMTSASKDHGCNSSKGRWVTDDSRPLYSGFGCKRWLSSMWACRLTQRTDFEYVKLRWIPRDCEMEEFTGVKFLKKMENKTLAFIGDSLGRQQFQSLMCMITGGEDRPDVLDVGYEYGLVKARHAVRPDGWAYRFPNTQTTILYYWSASLCNLTPINASNPFTDYAMHLDRPPAFLSHFLPRFDVLVLNTGHHWNRGKLNNNR